MTYSYTQLTSYITCPRRYRHKYRDGWEEKDSRASMLFGRAFEKALWKLSWFLRDFGYDPELLERDELEESSLIGLTGVIKISHTTVNGASVISLDSFAPASHWPDLSSSSGCGRSEVA